MTVSKLERLANNIANKIACELSYDKEKAQVIAYGLIALLQSVLMVVLVLILGFFLNILVESMILCFAVGILRKYAGGTHASSIPSCTTIGVIACILLGLLAKYLGKFSIPWYLLLAFCLVIFTYALIIAIRKAPMDSPNKPIRTEAKRRRMKISTITLLLLYFVISMVLFFYRDESMVVVSVLLSVLLSVMWQMSSLTVPGKVALEGLDHAIYKIITLKGGHNNEKD